MLVLGSLLALLSGMLNSAAAALEKREGMRTATDIEGLRLLRALAHRPLWLLALALSAAAWLCEATSLATAPVPIVATLRNAGRGLLVISGGRWLEERFSRPELLGVCLASLGAVLTAVGAARSSVIRTPLSNLTELFVAAVCCTAAAAVSVGFRWWAREGGGPWSRRRLRPQTVQAVPNDWRTKASGVATGTAVGLLFAGTGVFTKEIGDRFALYGPRGITDVVASPGLWLMIAMSVWSQSLLQRAFRRANAATVSAANATIASLGLIGASFVLYREALPRGTDGWLLVAGVAIAVAGTALLIGARPSTATGDLELDRA